MPERVFVAWSSGKDSAWMLHRLRADPRFEVAGLFTTVSAQRVAVHEVRIALLEAQSRAAGVPLHAIDIPHPCPNAVYEAEMARFVARARAQGVTHFAFGDLFLDDIRRYREAQLQRLAATPVFPLWGLPTRPLAQEMVASGLRAWITCVDTQQAPREWAGRIFDAEFVAQIPESIDACGERGEFHTFAFAGPMFSAPIATRCGQVTVRDRFVYADVLSSP
jgi:uncharacterized protein (TIGR00290 family)